MVRVGGSAHVPRSTSDQIGDEEKKRRRPVDPPGYRMAGARRRSVVGIVEITSGPAAAIVIQTEPNQPPGKTTMIAMSATIMTRESIMFLGAMLLVAGIAGWCLPIVLKKQLADELADDVSRFRALRADGDDEKARKVRREILWFRTLSARGLGIAIAGVVLVLIGYYRMK